MNFCQFQFRYTITQMNEPTKEFFFFRRGARPHARICVFCAHAHISAKNIIIKNKENNSKKLPANKSKNQPKNRL